MKQKKHNYILTTYNWHGKISSLLTKSPPCGIINVLKF